MKDKKHLFSVTIASAFLFIYLVLVSSIVVESKDSGDLRTSESGIEPIPVYYAECSDIEILSRIAPDSIYSINITVKNTGNEIWNKDGKEPVYISYHWKNTSGTVIHDGLRTYLPYDVKPGDTIISRTL